MYGFFSKLFNTYDPKFLLLLGYQYFVQGQKVMLILAIKDYFKDYLLLSPSLSA